MATIWSIKKIGWRQTCEVPLSCNDQARGESAVVFKRHECLQGSSMIPIDQNMPVIVLSQMKCTTRAFLSYLFAECQRMAELHSTHGIPACDGKNIPTVLQLVLYHKSRVIGTCNISSMVRSSRHLEKWFPTLKNCVATTGREPEQHSSCDTPSQQLFTHFLLPSDLHQSPHLE